MKQKVVTNTIKRKRSFKKEFTDAYYKHYKTRLGAKKPKMYKVLVGVALLFLCGGLCLYTLSMVGMPLNKSGLWSALGSCVIGCAILKITDSKYLFKEYKSKLKKESIQAIDDTFNEIFHSEDILCKENAIEIFKKKYRESLSYSFMKVVSNVVKVIFSVLYIFISFVYPSATEIKDNWFVVAAIGYIVIEYMGTNISRFVAFLFNDYLYERVCNEYKYYLAEKCVYGQVKSNKDGERIEKHIKIRYRLKEAWNFVTFAFYPKTTLIACVVLSVVVITILRIGMLFTVQDSVSYNIVFALTTGAFASIFVTFVVEMSNNYRHNKLAWYELQDYYLAVMKYESYKQVMMQQTPHQRAERKAYDEFVAAGGVEDKAAPKDIIQITWEQLPDLISILRRTYNDKKEFLSDAEIEGLKSIFSYYEQIQFAVRERILMSPMTYDALNHPDEEYLKSIYPAGVIKNMPDWIRHHLSSEESQKACDRYADTILVDSFLLSEFMKNYDISQNGIDRYQDEIDHMEETEADEPEDIDYDEVDFSEPDDEETFRTQNEEFDRQIELEQRAFVSWQLSKCCLDIAEKLDILEKSIRKKPYYGMMIKRYNDCARVPLDDTISILSYEREKRRFDKELERQRTADSENIGKRKSSVSKDRL